MRENPVKIRNRAVVTIREGATHFSEGDYIFAKLWLFLA